MKYISDVARKFVKEGYEREQADYAVLAYCYFIATGGYRPEIPGVDYSRQRVLISDAEMIKIKALIHKKFQGNIFDKSTAMKKIIIFQKGQNGKFIPIQQVLDDFQKWFQEVI